MKFKLAILFSICISVYYVAFAEDTVIYHNSTTGRQVKITGTIESYGSNTVLFRLASGQIKSISTDSIIEIQTDRPASYLEAELRMKDQEFAQAFSLLERALAQASDGWRKYEILAKQIECLMNLNRVDDAVIRYIQLMNLDSDTAFYDCVPLAWTSVELMPKTQQLVQSQIFQQKNPYVALLSASLLMTSADKKNEVQTALNALAKSENANIATLAQMQIHRLSLTPLSQTALTNLEKKVDVLPKSLQFGPRFVLGQLWSRSSAEGTVKTDKAALNYLQCAINSKTPVELQARAFYSAGAVLLNDGRRDEAFRIFRRLVEKFPDSQWAQQAQRTADGKL